MHSNELPYLREILVFLVAAIVVVPLFRRLKASPVLGYLAVGVLVGPHGLAIVPDVEGPGRVAQLGVMFLLFTIGLELTLDRLRQLRRFVFGLGPLQVAASSAAIGGVALAFDVSGPAAVVIGGALALSSTAVVVQMMTDREELATPSGRATFGVLLFQDLAVVPLIVFISLVGAGQSESVWVALGNALGRAVVAVGVIVVVGRFLLRELYRVVARADSEELFMAMTLLAVLATAVVTEMAGLSMALGAFLAGLILAETEFRPQIEADIRPFRGILLGLFFISIGMGIDVGAVAALFQWVAAAVAALLIFKAALVVGFSRYFGLSQADALRTGFLLAGSGEFAFVLMTSAISVGVVSPVAGQFVILVAGLTLVLTPLVDALGVRVADFFSARSANKALSTPSETAELQNHVVIAGFGRVGQVIAHLLRDQGISYVALDFDAKRTMYHHKHGEPIFYGDAAQADVLKGLQLSSAAAVVITLNRDRHAARALQAIREHHPDLPVFVRARDELHGAELNAFNPTGVVPETLEASLQLAGQVLRALGLPASAVSRLLERARREKYDAIRAVNPYTEVQESGEPDAP